jgi:hypothetical protein
MTIQTDDIRAAVSAGIINEAQAASLSRLADERQGYRQSRSVDDEPFELFKGFNEIFIVVGISILFTGWSAITGISTFSTSSGYGATIFLGIFQLLALVGLTMYFTQKRRMIAPSILMSFLVGMSGTVVGTGISGVISGDAETLQFIIPLVAALILFAYWYAFHIPISLMFGSLAVFAFVVLLITGGVDHIDSPQSFFLLSSDTNISIVTLGMGLVALVCALYFDQSDPHRVTRRSANAFWLHVLAAPAIVNSIGMTLYSNGGAISYSFLLLFLAIISIFAIVIDRRSFLMSGIGYMIALIFTVADGGYGMIVFLIGLGLVLIGANWEKMRAAILDSLPAFRGKESLPPWHTAPKETA